MANKKLSKTEKKVADDLWEYSKQANMQSDNMQMSSDGIQNTGDFTYSFADLDDDFDMNVQRLSDNAEAILAWITRPDIKASTRAKNLGYIRAVMSHFNCTEEQKRPYTLAWIRNKNEERGLVAPSHKCVTSA